MPDLRIGYLPSHKASLSLDRYQMPGDSVCERLESGTAGGAQSNPRPFESQVQRPNRDYVSRTPKLLIVLNVSCLQAAAIKYSVERSSLLNFVCVKFPL